MTMRFPLLFLDVDGVLNSARWCREKPPGGGIGIDPSAARHLQRIIDETGCKLVLSSTWRKDYSIAVMRSKLIAAGMRDPVPLIGYTPDLDEPARPGCVINLAPTRGREVQQWIDTNGFSGPYVCLDDEVHDFLPAHPLVQTTFHNGLMREHADACIAILTGT